MFAMNMDIGISYKWIVTTITGYLGDFFFMPGLEYMFVKFIIPNFFLLLQLRFCFYGCFKKDKKKKKIESESSDEHASVSDRVSHNNIKS